MWRNREVDLDIDLIRQESGLIQQFQVSSRQTLSVWKGSPSARRLRTFPSAGGGDGRQPARGGPVAAAGAVPCCRSGGGLLGGKRASWRGALEEPVSVGRYQRHRGCRLHRGAAASEGGRDCRKPTLRVGFLFPPPPSQAWAFPPRSPPPLPPTRCASDVSRQPAGETWACSATLLLTSQRGVAGSDVGAYAGQAAATCAATAAVAAAAASGSAAAAALTPAAAAAATVLVSGAVVAKRRVQKSNRCMCCMHIRYYARSPLTGLHGSRRSLMQGKSRIQSSPTPIQSSPKPIQTSARRPCPATSP